ncbi:hypothetical protein DUNSADRAFT_12041, partial [Dunaliella salina]
MHVLQEAPRILTKTSNMRYVERLMDLEALPSATYGGRRQEERRKAEDEVARLEQAMMVGRRWQPLEAPYQQALSELKQHHIQRLHLLVEKHVNAIRAHTSALQRRHSTARNRHDITQLSRTRSKARGSLKAAIQELQYWHRIPLHGPWASSSQS